MTNEFFKKQIGRLQLRFGAKAFDNEFIQLVWREIHDMSDYGFTRLVDVLIGSRSANKPPLLSDFREARLREAKIKFENEANQAAQVMEKSAWGGDLRACLARMFGSECKSLKQAVNMKIEMNRLERMKNNSEPDGAA